MKYWLLILMLFGHPAWAQIRPSPGNGDVRLQTVMFDPEQIVRLDVASGYQLMVSFATGERIETIAVGDSTAWQVSTNKRGDHLFIKIVQPSEGTNLTVITDARVYSFELARAPYAGGDLPFKVQFIYPEATKAVTVEASETTEAGLYRYRLSGARAIRPSAIGEESGNTVIEWLPKTPLPAIFRLDDDGGETLVNGEMQEGRFIVSGLPTKLIFRLDRLIAAATRLRIRGARR